MKNRDEEFVTIWQRSNTIAEFCEITGLKPSYVVVKASRLRRDGIQLKRMGSKTPGDKLRLARLAEELSHEQPA